MEDPKHLGKKSLNPKKYDPTLLEIHSRESSRESNRLSKKLPMVGWDIMNCYEFSTLDDSGNPIQGILRIKYCADSKHIIESKSLKLYLNSFNMAIFRKSTLLGIIKLDLVKALGEDVEVYMAWSSDDFEKPMTNPFSKWGTVGRRSGEVYFKSDSLRSLCKFTHQPDFGDIYIHLEGVTNVSHGELEKLIQSLRNESHFHEEICELIFSILVERYNPSDLFVGCFYTRRGGLDINPLRASKYFLIPIDLLDLKILFKTFRQ